MADVNVKVSADSSGVSSGLAKAQEAVNSFKESASDGIKDIGGELTKAFAAGAIIESIKGIAEEFTDISKQSEKFGESAETIQRVSQAAKLSGTDFETVSKALDKVTINAVEATRGNEKLNDAFQELGVNAAEFADLPMEEKLKELADGYNKAGSNAEALTAAQLVLGKGSHQLTDLLKQGSQGLTETFNNATVASQDTVDTIAEVTDRFISMFQTVKVWGADALGFLINGAKSLGVGLAAVTAYVENLSHGFKAATQAYNDVIQAAADIQIGKDDGRAAKEREAREQAGATAREEASNAVSDTETGNEKKIQSLRDEYAKKIEEAKMRQLNLAGQQVELQRQIADLDNQIANAESTRDEEAGLKAKNAKLDLQRELQENLDKQADKEGELQRKDDEGVVKHESAYTRAIALAQREYEINQELAKLNDYIAEAKARGDSAALPLAEQKKLELQRQLQDNLDKQVGKEYELQRQNKEDSVSRQSGYTQAIALVQKEYEIKRELGQLDNYPAQPKPQGDSGALPLAETKKRKLQKELQENLDRQAAQKEELQQKDDEGLTGYQDGYARVIALAQKECEIKGELGKLEDYITGAKARGDSAALPPAENKKLELQKELQDAISSTNKLVEEGNSNISDSNSLHSQALALAREEADVVSQIAGLNKQIADEKATGDNGRELDATKAKLSLERDLEDIRKAQGEVQGKTFKEGEDNAEKLQGARSRSIALVQREAEINQEIATLNREIAEAKGRGDGGAVRHGQELKKNLEDELAENLNDQGDTRKDIEKAKQEVAADGSKAAEAARLRSISLAERELQIIGEIAEQEGKVNEAKASGNQRTLDAANVRKAQLQDELANNIRDGKAMADRAREDDKAASIKAAKDKAAAELEAKKDALNTANAKLDELRDSQQARGIRVDDMRAVGGNAHTFDNGGRHESLIRQQVTLQRQTVEQLKMAVKALEARDKYPDSTGNGAFNLS